MWAQILNALLGVGLMAAPGVFGLSNPAADNFYIFGPVATTFGVVACWEATRAVRWGNGPIGLWLLVAPFVLAYGGIAMVVSLVAGAVMTTLSLVEGNVEKSYGGGWLALVRPARLACRDADTDRAPESGQP